jgi:hypothetical protein
VSVKAIITDGTDNGFETKVTPRNQLVVAPLEYSEFYTVTVCAINVGKNVIPPITNQQFVITDIVLYADKAVGNCDATVVIFEAESDITATVTRSIIDVDMPKKTSLPLTGLNIITSEGRWINAKTNDNNIKVNIGGYYVRLPG